MSDRGPGGRRPKVLVVDGPSLAHRAYHAYEAQGTVSRAGAPIWALQGFVNLLSDVVTKVAPAAVIVGWDGDSRTSIRRERYPDYKATRAAKPEALTQQLRVIPALVTELGFTLNCPDGLEADDVLASVAATVESRQGVDCVIATSDRDSFSLISGRTTVLRLVNGGINNAVWMDPRALFDAYGLKALPNQYLDYAALRGDPSDNLPGVPGFGEKTAARLLAAAGSVEAALGSPEATVTAIGKSAAGKLVAGEAAWRLNRELMGMRKDLPVDLDSARRIPAGEHVTAVCARWELRGARLATSLDRMNPQSSNQPRPPALPGLAGAATRPATASVRARRLIPGRSRSFPVTL